MISAKAGEETASFAYEQALLQGSLAYSIEYYYQATFKGAGGQSEWALRLGSAVYRGNGHFTLPSQYSSGSLGSLLLHGAEQQLENDQTSRFSFKTARLAKAFSAMWATLQLSGSVVRYFGIYTSMNNKIAATGNEGTFLLIIHVLFITNCKRPNKAKRCCYY